MSNSEKSYELTEALSRLIHQHPFFAVLLLDLLVIKEVEGDNAPIPTAGTDGRYLYINTGFFAALTLDERVFLLCHEVMHVVLEHPKRGKLYLDRGIGPDLKKYDPMRMNKAMDYIINDWIIKSGNNSMPGGGLLDTKYGMSDVADEVYCKLPPEPDNPNAGNGQAGNGFDSHMPQNSTGAHSKADVQRAMKSAAVSAKAQGKLPGNMERLVDEICEPQVDWAEQLNIAITTSAGRDDATWARPNRKRLAISPHVYLPGTCSHKAGTIAMYIDTSGSVGDDELKHFFGEMASIVDDIKPELALVGSCDSTAYDPHEVESGDDLLSYRPEGGGGTHMPAIFDKLREHNIVPDALVILTDGWTDFGEYPGYDVIWVMTTDKEAPFGVNLHIKINNSY